MRQEVELNESQERKLNRIRQKALKNREKIEKMETDSRNKKAAIFYNEFKENEQEKRNTDNVLKSGLATLTSSKDKAVNFMKNKVDDFNKKREQRKVEKEVAEINRKAAKIKQEKLEEEKKQEENKEIAVLPVSEPVETVVDEQAVGNNIVDKQEEVVETDKTQSLDKQDEVVEKQKKEKKALLAGLTKKDKVKTEKVKTKKVKEKRPKAKKVTFVFAILMCLLLFVCLCGGIAAILFASKLLEDKPTLDVENLISPDSTTVYDAQGNKIMELGMYLRENIEYKDMPNHLIDAFLSIEDSRFFEHPGFDIPRFTKAAMANLQSGDFSQGGSTITMQLIKNTYFSIDADDESTIAAREGMSGIKRKMQEIVLALELELRTDITKQQIIAMYINKVNYGDNIRGVQKAAEYYFGKDAKNLNLTESAFLAGLINSPNTYNPYNDLYKEDNY